MSFYDWFKEADKELSDAVTKNADKGINDRKKGVLPLYSVYIQERLYKATRGLVIATWVLAIATIILSFIR